MFSFSAFVFRDRKTSPYDLSSLVHWIALYDEQIEFRLYSHLCRKQHMGWEWWFFFFKWTKNKKHCQWLSLTSIWSNNGWERSRHTIIQIISSCETMSLRNSWQKWVRKTEPNETWVTGYLYAPVVRVVFTRTCTSVNKGFNCELFALCKRSVPVQMVF